MRSNKDLVLVFGATGNSGFHIAHKLLKEGCPARIFCRSEQKVHTIFGQNAKNFEKIISGDITKQEDLDRAFAQSSQYGKVRKVISALGALPFVSENQVENIELVSQIAIIDKCKQYKIQKYVYISAALMERPYNPITVLLNTIVANDFHYKLMAQNYIRQSGLFYIIIRPPQLVGEKQDFTQTNYLIDQGDKTLGKVTRCTLGKIAFQAMESDKIPSKVTFECAGVEENKQKPDFGSLNEQITTKIIADHKFAKRCCCTGCILVVLLIIAGVVLGVVLSK